VVPEKLFQEKATAVRTVSCIVGELLTMAA
jgi:hypothetical protein